MMLGIHVLISAYKIKDPFAFMLSFFASNFIILISATLLIAFAIRLAQYRKAQRIDTSENEEHSS
jgi:hypothetical protein